MHIHNHTRIMSSLAARAATDAARLATTIDELVAVLRDTESQLVDTQQQLAQTKRYYDKQLQSLLAQLNDRDQQIETLEAQLDEREPIIVTTTHTHTLDHYSDAVDADVAGDGNIDDGIDSNEYYSGDDDDEVDADDGTNQYQQSLVTTDANRQYQYEDETKEQCALPPPRSVHTQSRMFLTPSPHPTGFTLQSPDVVRVNVHKSLPSTPMSAASVASTPLLPKMMANSALPSPVAAAASFHPLTVSGHMVVPSIRRNHGYTSRVDLSPNHLTVGRIGQSRPATRPVSATASPAFPLSPSSASASNQYERPPPLNPSFVAAANVAMTRTM